MKQKISISTFNHVMILTLSYSIKIFMSNCDTEYLSVRTSILLKGSTWPVYVLSPICKTKEILFFFQIESIIKGIFLHWRLINSGFCFWYWLVASFFNYGSFYQDYFEDFHLEAFCRNFGHADIITRHIGPNADFLTAW